jgi:hypothetical protein
MRGYVAAKGIPVPSSRRPGEAAGLDIGERSINIFKKEIAKANREWAELAKTASQREAARWEKMPKGWTDESRKKFWDSLVGDVKHKVTKCIKEMEGKFDDPGAFCASLADRVDPGWRSRDKKSSEELVAAIAERVAADMFFDPTPNWDKVRFSEPKKWVFNWKGGGWNSSTGKTKKEAIANAKKRWKGSEWDGKWDERTFRVPTESEYRSLLRMFD